MSICKDCIHENVCDALIKDGLPWNDGEYPAEAFCMAFRNKADVVEVRHGEWEVWGLCNPKCSLCKNYNYAKDRYCPNCGAKMDGERREQK